MDEKTNSKIEELKRNPPNRFLPVLVLFLAVVVLFLYRVATTDPEWNAAAPAAKTTSVPAKAKPVTAAPAKQTAKSVPSQDQAHTDSAPSTSSDEPAAPAPATTASTDNDEAAKAKPATSLNPAMTDAYLERHINRSIPFLYKGEAREVTLTAFTASTITIRHGKKALTLERATLSPEQLELWK